MDKTDMALLAGLADGVPLVLEPFREVGIKTGLPEEEVLFRLAAMKEDGIIRKFHARINQRNGGITANALVAWHTGAEEITAAGAIMGSFPGVTHCYQREPVPGKWEYELYTVHHARNEEEIYADVRRLANRVGIYDYQVLFSGNVYKRTPAITASVLEGVDR